MDIKTVSVISADGVNLAPMKLDRALSMMKQGKAEPVVIRLTNVKRRKGRMDGEQEK